MRIFSLIIVIIIGLLGITFAILNASPVTIHYYIGKRTLPLSVLMLISLVTGVLLGYLVSMKPLFRLKCENRRLNHRIKEVEQEVENLRHIPIRDEH